MKPAATDLASAPDARCRARMDSGQHESGRRIGAVQFRSFLLFRPCPPVRRLPTISWRGEQAPSWRDHENACLTFVPVECIPADETWPGTSRPILQRRDRPGRWRLNAELQRCAASRPAGPPFRREADDSAAAVAPFDHLRHALGVLGNLSGCQALFAQHIDDFIGRRPNARRWPLSGSVSLPPPGCVPRGRLLPSLPRLPSTGWRHRPVCRPGFLILWVSGRAGPACAPRRRPITAAGFAGPCCFDGGIERQQVGLLRNLL